MQCGIRLPSVRARIPAGCRIRSQRVRLPVRCSAVTGSGYELALGDSQTCNIWLPSVDDTMKNQLYHGSRSNSNINSISIRYSVCGDKK